MKKVSRLLTAVLGFSCAFGIINTPAPAQSEKDPLALPVVSLKNFSVGQEYTWEYFENGQLYSTENYKVISSNLDKLILEMSTRLGDEVEFKLHHRLEVSLKSCLKAYENPLRLRPWRLKMYYWRQDQWNLVEGLNSTLAFEEKFNCNPHSQKLPGKEVAFVEQTTALGLRSLFQFRPFKSHTDRTSWFFLNGPEAGLLAFKRMSEAKAPLQYEIHFLSQKLGEKNQGPSLTDLESDPH